MVRNIFSESVKGASTQAEAEQLIASARSGFASIAGYYTEADLNAALGGSGGSPSFNMALRGVMFYSGLAGQALPTGAINLGVRQQAALLAAGRTPQAGGGSSTPAAGGSTFDGAGKGLLLLAIVGVVVLVLVVR